MASVLGGRAMREVGRRGIEFWRRDAGAVRGREREARTVVRRRRDAVRTQRGRGEAVRGGVRERFTRADAGRDRVERRWIAGVRHALARIRARRSHLLAVSKPRAVARDRGMDFTNRRLAKTAAGTRDVLLALGERRSSESFCRLRCGKSRNDGSNIGRGAARWLRARRLGHRGRAMDRRRRRGFENEKQLIMSLLFVINHVSTSRAVVAVFCSSSESASNIVPRSALQGVSSMSRL